MQHMTISEVSASLGISTRTLRYYEQIGLISSVRPMDYAYRTYDGATLMRLGQIVLLRRLRIPLSQIEELLRSDDARQAIAAFEQRAAELSAEIDALNTVRGVLAELIRRLNEIQPLRLSMAALSDESLLMLTSRLAPEPTRLKERKNMDDLIRAESELGKLRDVRTLYLPPATVAAAHFIGPDPERVAGTWMADFVRASNLIDIKPDLRLYGFNHPSPVDETNAHGYEFWVTIPDDMDVPAPLTKRHFPGGLYIAHMIRMGDFHEWAYLSKWLEESAEYAFRGEGNPENMCDSLEEHLNYYSYIKGDDSELTQLDLLIPVRKKSS